MADAIKYREQFEYWENATDVARTLSRRDRDYRDHKQWTSKQQEVLSERGQAAIVINRIAPKIDFMVGVERSNKQDPKAWPRTPQHAEASDAVTDSLRYVSDNTEIDATFSDSFEDLLIEGVEGAVIEWMDNEISVTRIPFDRVYYDPHSNKRHFEDATYKGLFIWMDADDAIRQFGKKEDITSAISNEQTAGLEDKPDWLDKKRKRIKVCQHYYKENGVWFVTYFSGDIVLIEPKESPYKDENNKPTCPIELAHAYIDREGNRYGWARQFIDIQDEINHRRSKALYILSRRQVIADRGAVNDIYEAKSQLARGDGVIEVTPGMRFDVDPGNDLAAGQTMLLQEAKTEIDSIANRSIVGGDASGRSRMMADNKNMIEVGPLFDTHRQWKKRVYRQIWNRIKHFWDSERWIRVTDNENNLKFVGLNQPITLAQQLQERAQQGDQLAAQALQVGMASNEPRLQQIVETKNDVAQLDVDITISEVMDAANVQQEQFEMLVNLAQVYGPQFVPFKTVVEMSQIRGKRDIIDALEGDPQQAQINQQIQMQQLEMQMAQMQAKIAKLNAEAENKAADTKLKQAETAKTGQQTVQTAVETQVLLGQPVDSVNVNT